MDVFIKVLSLFFILVEINTESSEVSHAYTYYNSYAPSTLNFNDIYTNNVIPSMPDIQETKIQQDPPTPITTTEDAFLNTIHTQFVEFRPDIMTMPPVTVPPPKYILNATFAKEDGSTTTTTTTEDPEEEVKVVPIKRNYQRGVLDLLFPSARVKNFKNIFDSIRRILSHTFRR